MQTDKRLKIEFTTPPYSSFRSVSIASTFNVEIDAPRVKTIDCDAPPSLEEEWRVGFIVGPSGSGKTTVARRCYDAAIFERADWDERPIVECFDKSLSVAQISGALSSVGFASVPSWLQSYATLSNGERFRADLARAISAPNVPLVVFDEFTSVVDRTTAKTASFAVSKAIRKRDDGARFVAVACHYDIADWLEPDWVLDMRSGDLTRRRLRRPQISLEIRRCQRDVWRLFAPHHYLTGEIKTNAWCYLATLEGVSCAFLATINSMGHKQQRRVHRLVVLPEFQGVGIGQALLKHVADYEIKEYKLKAFCVTSGNKFFARALMRSPNWTLLKIVKTGSDFSKNSVEATSKGFGKTGRARSNFKFIGL